MGCLLAKTIWIHLLPVLVTVVDYHMLISVTLMDIFSTLPGYTPHTFRVFWIFSVWVDLQMCTSCATHSRWIQVNTVVIAPTPHPPLPLPPVPHLA